MRQSIIAGLLGALLVLGCQKSPEPAVRPGIERGTSPLLYTTPPTNGIRTPAPRPASTRPDIPECAARDSSLAAVFSGSAQELDTAAVVALGGTPFEDDTPYGSCRVPGPIYERITNAFPDTRSELDPDVFLVGRVSVEDSFSVYAIRVPGMYGPSKIDLLVVRPSDVLPPSLVPVSHGWGDAGELYWMRSWILDVNGDGSRDVVRHICNTYRDPGSNDPVSVSADDLEVQLWNGSGFAASTEPDSAIRHRFDTGNLRCLPSGTTAK